MNWDLIPEVFFDLIARVFPGSILLVGMLAVRFGPAGFSQVVEERLPSANSTFLLLFGLLAYFVAIVMKEFWESLAAIPPRKGQDRRPPSGQLLVIQKRIPSEASRLRKLQAEKNMCEVLVPGLAILLLGNLWMILAGNSGDLGERVALAAVFLTSGVACWRWRRRLERLYREDLADALSASTLPGA